MCVRLQPMKVVLRERIPSDSTSLIGHARKGMPKPTAWRLSRLLNILQSKPRHGSWGSLVLVLIFAGCMRSGIARTGHLPWAPTLPEPREIFRLHCPGSRLDRRPGPAATHFGNRRSQDSGRWGRQHIAGLPSQDTIGVRNWSKQPFTVPRSLRISSRQRTASK